MAAAEDMKAPSTTWLESVVGLFIKPTRLQIAALCYRMTVSGVEVLLLTSREKGRWILPKGWPELELEAHETALLEAYEEAGVRGNADRQPYAKFASYKGLEKGLQIRTTVLAFRIEVTEILEDYPEKGQRQVEWMPIDEAIQRADEQGVKRLLKRFKKDMARSRIAA